MNKNYVRIFCVLILFMAFGVSCTSAANWQVVNNWENVVMYVDIDDVRMASNNLSVWVKGEYVKNSSYQKAGDYWISLFDYSMSNSRLYVKSGTTTFYKKNGKVDFQGKGSDWQPVIPESNAESIFFVALKYAR